jgi:GntR family transcriptional regulator, trigonelline degradation regulator
MSKRKAFLMIREGTSLAVLKQAAPVREQVVSNLRKAITQGQFQPGERLIERELCALTGVSRTSIREALRQLEAEGLLENVPNKGIIVGTLTRAEAEDIYQVRSSLEELASRLYAERATDEGIATLRKAMQAIEEAYHRADEHALLQAKKQFHEELLHGCGNTIIAPLLLSVYARIAFLRSLSLSQPGRPAHSVAEVRHILLAIEQRDPEKAALACRVHVQNAARAALTGLAQHNNEQWPHRGGEE